MSRFIRAGGLVLVAGLAVSLSGCVESTNTGKLEGTKWSSAYVPDFHGISGKGMSMTMQFSEGGRFTMELCIPQGATLRCGGKWRLGAGDTVYLDDVAPALSGNTSFTESMRVIDDTLTMTDPDGTTIVFTKIDAEMEKANKSNKATAKKTDKPETGPGGEVVSKNGKAVTRTYGPEPKGAEPKKKDD